MKLKEQLAAKQQQKDEEDESGKKVPKKRRGVKGSTQGRKGEPPANSLSLEFVHG